MAKTRIIRNLRLDKIAAVDRPCQEGAIVAIIKRDQTSGDGPEADIRKETIMSTIEKKVHDDAIAALKVEHDAAIGVQTTELAKLKDQLAELVAKASMSDGEKECMEDMDEDQKKKFLGMNKPDRKKLMGKRATDDETLDVGGAVIRKSKVGEDVFAAMKFQQEQISNGATEVKKAREEAETARLEKRADDEFKSLPGTAIEKALVLKALAKEPEAVRKTFDAMMKAAEANMSGAFRPIGTQASKLEVAKGQQPFLAKVTEIEKGEKVSRMVALRKAQETYPDEFEAYQSAGRELTPAPVH